MSSVHPQVWAAELCGVSGWCVLLPLCSSSSSICIVNLDALLCRASTNSVCSPFFKTELSTRASRSVATKASKRRSKNAVEGTEDLSYKELKIWVLIIVSGRKTTVWSECRSAIEGNKDYVKRMKMSPFLSPSLTCIHTHPRACQCTFVST